MSRDLHEVKEWTDHAYVFMGEIFPGTRVNMLSMFKV